MDTSSARSNILARIRAAQRRAPESTEAEQQAAAEYLRQHPSGPRPAAPADLVERFRAEALRLSTSVDEVATLDDAPAAVSRYLTGLDLPRQAVAWSTLRALAWAEAGCALEFRAPRDADLIGITGCFCAVAETGTLALVSGPETPASTSLLPETHIALVPVSRILAGHEDALRLIIAERGALSRATNFISGPSRTGDIEQTIILGAHGPYRVHVILIRDA